MREDPKSLALAYMDAISNKELDKVEALLAPDLKFVGPSMARSTASDFIAALKRLAAIHVRNEVKRLFADGDEVCIIYDFVTDSPAGALPTIEWLHFERGRIRSINLYYDRVPWKTVMEEMSQRAVRPTA